MHLQTNVLFLQRENSIIIKKKGISIIGLTSAQNILYFLVIVHNVIQKKILPAVPVQYK